jgi:5-formyltetrahydrofolate cyclo-ligase
MPDDPRSGSPGHPAPLPQAPAAADLPVALGKPAWRAELRRRRRALPSAERRRQEAAIIACLLARLARHPPGSGTVLSYLAMPDEVDLDRLHALILEQGLRLLVPAVAGPGRLRWHGVASAAALADLPVGALGIREPPAGTASAAVPPDAMILVPGLGFTRDGWRLGYGGGYYDRLLAGQVGQRIGIAYDCQMCEELPHAAHDERLDGVVAAGAWIPSGRPLDRADAASAPPTQS